jgi:transcriptional regulator
MYPPKYFQTSEEEQHKLRALINDNPLATLLVNIDEFLPHISHIPFHFVKGDASTEIENKVLIAHVSNQHPLAAILLAKGDATLGLVFHGEHSYISPHCHTKGSGNTNGQVVPTWNYAKVHVTGIATPIIDPELKYQQLKISSQHFEREQLKPWELTEVSNKKIRQMLTAITFFKVRINTFEGRFKLSQNKPIAVRTQIAVQVARDNKPLLAKKIRDL